MALVNRTKAGRPESIEDWHVAACEMMVRTGCTLQEAAGRLSIPLNSDGADLLYRRASFNRLLWEARHRYFNDLASSPNWRKDTAIGRLLVLAQKLEEEGSFDKAAEVIFKIGKMAGWVGPESTVSVFGELSQRDLDAIRESVAKDGTSKQVN